MKKHDLRYGGTSAGKEEFDAIVKSVRNSIKTGNWQTGPEAKKMEEEAAKQLGVKYGILTTSGSCAGLLALAALELPKGSEVIIPAVTFPTMFNIILQCGLIPVVVDVDATYTIDPTRLEKALSKKTKAIIAVHAVGNPCDMRAIMKIAKKHDLYVIEDNCDGWGSAIAGRMVGSFGDVSISSFHAAHIVSMGVGGGVFTNSVDLARKVRMYRDWGRQADTTGVNKHSSLPKDYNPRFVYEKIGYNFQILELQAAMGRVQLKKAKQIKEARQANAEELMDKLMEYPLLMPSTVRGADVCWFSLPLTCMPGDRAKLVPHLEKHGIETRSMFSGDITKHPAYKGVKYRIGNKLDCADYVLRESFWISTHPRLTKSDIDYMIDVFKRFYESRQDKPK